jgi:3-hydroxyisobutyrate dehydrogenase-like beta-hydroxyacid dehydrogenase
MQGRDQLRLDSSVVQDPRHPMSHPTRREMPMPDASLLGLGKMGRALAATLLDAGLSVTVWNRTPAPAADLVARGAIEAGDPTEAVLTSDLVIACVLDYPTTVALLDVPALHDLTGRSVLQLASGHPHEARRLEAMITARGGRYLDGFVKAYPSTVGSQDSLVLCSGSRDAFARHQDVLGALGRLRFVGEDVAVACHLNNAAAAMMEIIVGGFIEGFAYAVGAGVSSPDVIAMFPEAVRIAHHTIDDAVAQWRRAPDGVAPAVEAAINVHRSGMESIVAAMEDQGRRADLANAMLGYLQHACAQGLGDCEIAALLALHRAPRPR